MLKQTRKASIVIHYNRRLSSVIQVANFKTKKIKRIYKRFLSHLLCIMLSHNFPNNFTHFRPKIYLQITALLFYQTRELWFLQTKNLCSELMHVKLFYPLIRSYHLTFSICEIILMLNIAIKSTEYESPKQTKLLYCKKSC